MNPYLYRSQAVPPDSPTVLESVESHVMIAHATAPTSKQVECQQRTRS